MPYNNRSDMLQSIAETPWKVLPSHRTAVAVPPHLEAEAEELSKLAPEQLVRVADFKRLLLEKSCYGLLQDPAYNKPVVTMALDSEKWIREVKTWKRRSQMAEKQFFSLLIHLYEAYPTPAFLRRAWRCAEDQPRAWYCHVAEGKSIRTIPGLPFPLTKKMAHLVRRVPGDLEAIEGLRWAQVMGMDGDERLFRGIAGSFLREKTDREDFWGEVIAWMVQRPDLNYDLVGPVLDYLRAAVNEDASYKIKGRTWKSVMRNVDAWHARLRFEALQERKGNHKSWMEDQFVDLERVGEYGEKKLGFRPVKSYLSPIGECKTYADAIVSISQILNGAGLLKEGRKMNHCVAGYREACLTGKTSIWTMQVWDGNKEKDLLTIELQLQNRRIVQVRGKCNRRATKEEVVVIKSWAREEDLRVSRHI